MELTQLIQFIAIAQNNSISLAAKKLHISQPALSTSLKKLENELGVNLFEHHKNRIVLNDAGKIALKHAENIINLSQALKKDIDEYKTKNLKIKIGFCDPGPMWYLVPHFSLIIDKITYEAFTFDEDEIEVLLQEKYDLIISSKPLNHIEIENVPFFKEAVLLSVSENHPLASCKSLSLTDPRIEAITRYYIPGYRFSHKQNSLWQKVSQQIKLNFVTDYFVFCQTLSDPNIITTTTKLVKHYRNDGKRILIPLIDNQMQIHYHLSYLKTKKSKLQPIIEIIKNSVQ